MENLNTDFPAIQATKISKKFLKAEDFQDKEVTVKYLGWKKKANEDTKEMSWKERIKYTLFYSYPEWATDQYGEKRLHEGKPFRNENWDENYPHGYFVVYVFAEGELECSSKPLWVAFRKANPKVGDQLTLKRTGDGKETKWAVVANEYKQFEPSVKAPF